MEVDETYVGGRETNKHANKRLTKSDHLGGKQAVVTLVERDGYHNELLAFDLAYRFCAAYEDDPISTDFDYVHNMCRYLRSEMRNLTVDTCFMLFKSLMRR